MKHSRFGDNHPDYPSPGFYLETKTVDEILGSIPIRSAEDEATSDYIKPNFYGFKGVRGRKCSDFVEGGLFRPGNAVPNIRV